MIGNYVVLSGDNTLNLVQNVNDFLRDNPGFQLQGGVSVYALHNNFIQYFQALYKPNNLI